MKRLRVGVIFGGRSVEHDVSLVSARSVLSVLDPARYEVVPIGVTRAGEWLTSRNVQRMLDAGVGRDTGDHAALLADPSVGGLVRLGEDGRLARDAAPMEALDVVFPLIHGGYGEDGKLQGPARDGRPRLRRVRRARLGPGHGQGARQAALRRRGHPVAPSLLVRAHAWRADPAAIVASIEGEIGYPCFVKPSGQGSSVGVARARHAQEAREAIEEALSFDDKVLVERAIDAREIEVAVLGNDAPQASVAGEIVTTHEFYDYEAKYHDDATRLFIPADIPAALSERLRSLAIAGFQALELSGMARVDFLVDRTTLDPYLNEVNTLPGFTPVSMYPKLWEATGLSYPRLVDRLIELALERHQAKRRLRTTRSPQGEAREAGKETRGA
jgi:D-alanine-D-alanine ligase